MVTYNVNQSFMNIQTNLGPTPDPADVERWRRNSSLPIQLLPPGNKGWRQLEVQNKIFSSQYHFNLGHCITLDISAISKNDGKFPIEYEDEKVNLMVVYFNREPMFEHAIGLSNFPKHFYMHNGTDIGLIGKDISGEVVFGGYMRVFLFFSNMYHLF